MDTCQKTLRGELLGGGGGRTGAEHREWWLDTLKSHINVNKLTISTPGVYFSMNMQKMLGVGLLHSQLTAVGPTQRRE